MAEGRQARGRFEGIVKMAETGEPLKIRGHHLLCVQGFQGYGYSPEFVANLAEIAERLKSQPDTEIELAVECDAICSVCPHREGQECRKKPESAGRVSAHDRRVLSRLGLQAGSRMEIAAAFSLANARLGSRSEAREVCGKCRWQEQCLWFASRNGP